MTHSVSMLSDLRRPKNNGTVAPNKHNHNLEAEQNVLGCLLIQGGSLVKKLPPRLEHGDFFKPAHGIIFDAILDLTAENKLCDPVSVAEYLGRGECGQQILSSIGGFNYLAQLANETIVTGEKACEYAVAILQHSVERRIRAAVNDPLLHVNLVEGVEYELRRLKAAAPAEPHIIPAPIDWSTLTGDPPERTWWIPDWLSPHPTLNSGAGGIGKTRLWQTLATSLVIQRDYLGPVLAPLKVLIWSCEEDTDEIWRTQDAINRYFGITMTDIAGRLHVVSRRGLDNTLLELVMGKPMLTPVYHNDLKQQINDLGVDMFVGDNIAQMYGCNESDRHQVTLFVNSIAGLVRDRPFCPVLLGHVARSQGSEFSGSAAWENAVRMRWYLGSSLPDQKPDEDEPVDPDVVYLARRKANYTAKDWRRLRFQNGLLVPEQPEGRRFDQSFRDDDAERIVLAAIPKLVAAGLMPTDGRTASDYLPAQIIAKGYGNGFPKKDLASAMNRLMGAGRLRREKVGTYSNRSPRYGLVIV